MTQFVNKGDEWLTDTQLEQRAQRYIARDWPLQRREKSIRLGDGQFDAFVTDFSANHDTNKANNLFNLSVERRNTFVGLGRYSAVKSPSVLATGSSTLS